MEAFDVLPADLREFINDLHFNLVDAHILGGAAEMRRVKNLLESGYQPTFYESDRN